MREIALTALMNSSCIPVSSLPEPDSGASAWLTPCCSSGSSGPGISPAEMNSSSWDRRTRTRRPTRIAGSCRASIQLRIACWLSFSSQGGRFAVITAQAQAIKRLIANSQRRAKPLAGPNPTRKPTYTNRSARWSEAAEAVES